MRRSFLILLVFSCAVLSACVTRPPVKQAETTPPPPAVQYAAQPLLPLTGEWILLPKPRQMEIIQDAHIVLNSITLHFEGVSNSSFLDKQIHEILGTASSDPRSEANVHCRITPATIPHPQGYQLCIDKQGIYIDAHDEAGLFYAIMTLKQIARLCPQKGTLPCLKVEDWPDFPHRGVMLDIARTKVPTMETLYALVDNLAEWKFNQFQLYTEHTFAYREHPLVWKEASPMTPEQIRSLDAYCRDREIELVPNQNSFGHMERWLKYPAYQSLGEKPSGGSDLCPTNPDNIAFLKGLYQDLLPNFSSRQINVGCDETYSIGKGRSKAAVEKQGRDVVYLDFLLKIYALVHEQGHTMQFWGDMVLRKPDLLAALKGKDLVALEWGYEADHPFDAHTQTFARAGIPFYVAPGTSSWEDIAGRTENAVENLRNAAENGLANGAIGYLVTDWGDNGHWQAPATSYLGYAYGAGVSWCYATNQNMPIPQTLDAHVFQDQAHVMGKLVYELGKTSELLGERYQHRLILQLLRKPELADAKIKSQLDKIGRNGFSDAENHLTTIMAPLAQARMGRSDAEQIRRQCQMTASLVRLACHLGTARVNANGMATPELPAATRHALAAELEPLIPEFKNVWLQANREGGLQESTEPLDVLLSILKE